MFYIYYMSSQFKKCYTSNTKAGSLSKETTFQGFLWWQCCMVSLFLCNIHHSHRKAELPEVLEASAQKHLSDLNETSAYRPLENSIVSSLKTLNRIFVFQSLPVPDVSSPFCCSLAWIVMFSLTTLSTSRFAANFAHSNLPIWVA